MTIELDGPSQWTGDVTDDDTFGQNGFESHKFTVEFGDGVEQVEMIDAVMRRVLESLGCPRPLHLLASLANGFDSDLYCDEESIFVEAAKKLDDFWCQHDKP